MTAALPPASYAYHIADFLIPGDGDNARGAPQLWVHLWMEAYRIANGRPHSTLWLDKHLGKAAEARP